MSLNRRVLISIVVLGGLLCTAFTASLTLARDPAAADDVGAQAQFMSADEVAAALRSAGLTVQNVTREPIQSSPSGPPATEREALRFVVTTREGEPLTGRILVFPTARALQQKADWFRRAGVSVVQHRNILVWLDADLDAPTLARYRQAVAGMR